MYLCFHTFNVSEKRLQIITQAKLSDYTKISPDRVFRRGNHYQSYKTIFRASSLHLKQKNYVFSHTITFLLFLICFRLRVYTLAVFMVLFFFC